MGIEIRQPGEAKAAATAGTMIGRAERAKEERARTEREQEQATQMAFQERARQVAMDWELQKMVLNSQQDFAQEQRLRQVELEKEARAREWEYEKMELASRIDFEQSEKERIRDTSLYRAAKTNIYDNKNLTDERKQSAHYQLDTIYAPKGVDEAVEGLGYKPQAEKQPSVEQQKWETLSPEEQQRAARISASLPGGHLPNGRTPRKDRQQLKAIRLKIM
jgi:hypothetical protein